MEGDSKRARNRKPSKIPRKSHPVSLHPIISDEISSETLHLPQDLTSRLSGNGTPDRLNDIIDGITSEGDDALTRSSSKASIRSTSNLVEPHSPSTNDNHLLPYPLSSRNSSRRDQRSPMKQTERSKKSSTKGKKLHLFKDKNHPSSNYKTNLDRRSQSDSRRKFVGDLRREKLTECMEHYRHCLESAQNSNTINMNDDPANNEKRKQYATILWYDKFSQISL